MGKKWDVIIIGGGPAGSAAGLSLKQRGIESVLLLEKAEYPRKKICAGGISPRAQYALDRLGLWEGIRGMAYPISGARIASSSGKEIHLSGVETAAVLPREQLDAVLAERAAAAGVRVLEKKRVQRLYMENGAAAGVETAEGIIRGKVIIGANGANTRFNLDGRKKKRLATAMAWFEDFSFRPNTLEMIFDPALKPHYCWLFPESDTRVNIGLTIEMEKLNRQTITGLFKGILEKHFGDRIAAAKQLGGIYSFPILPDCRVYYRSAPGTILAGEAARLVNMFTGEGISYALLSGEAAGKTAADAVKNRWTPEELRKRYEGRLKKAVGLSLGSGYLLYRYGGQLLNFTAYISNLSLVKKAVSSVFTKT